MTALPFSLNLEKTPIQHYPLSLIISGNQRQRVIIGFDDDAQPASSDSENLAMKFTDEVQIFWEKETCGTGPEAVAETSRYSWEWFKKIEDHRYLRERFRH